MSAYRYVKTKPKEIKKIGRWLPGLLLLGGLILLANAAWPIASYQFKNKEKFKSQLLAPTSQRAGQSVWQETAADYRQPSSWFPSAPQLPPRPSKITHYTLSIPKLGVKDAVVEIGGEDLMEAMIQYPGTALPGQSGNAAVFCHSSLPQFFSPKNYKTICSTLPEMEIGDEILVSFDGILYRYQVVKMVEVGPKDIEVLVQYYDDRYLSLITCVPPGTYLKRLIVRAKLV